MQGAACCRFWLDACPVGRRKLRRPGRYLEERWIKAIPLNYAFDALRKFCAQILLRFLTIHQELLRNRAASGRKIYTQILLAELCSIALNWQDGYYRKNSQRERQHCGGGGQISACHVDAPLCLGGKMFYFYKRMAGRFCDSKCKKIFLFFGRPSYDKIVEIATIKMHKKTACMHACNRV